ncbi:MAG TPA: lipopolysaccharide kinase InaA family protein [Candidatus Binatia bacterium]
MRLPPEFVVPRPGVAVRAGHEAHVAGWLAAAFDGRHDLGDAAEQGIVGGRGAVRRLPLDAAGDVYVRRYVHGGLLRRLLRDVYWERPPRPWRELVATEAARRAGVAAPEVLAAAALPLAGGGRAGLLYRGVLVTRALTGRRSLGEALRAARDDGERRAWIACAVRAVRTLHQAGIVHRDLNVSNVLVGASPEEPAALIDFDRAAVRARPAGALDVALARRRLARSIAKLGIAGLDRRGAAAVLRAAGLGGAP